MDEKVAAFLKELAELSAKYNIWIAACADGVELWSGEGAWLAVDLVLDEPNNYSVVS